MPPPLLTGYSAREAATLLGVAPERVRWFLRVGMLRPQRGARGEYRLSFQDLVLLRAAQGLLDAGVPVRRVRRALAQLPAQLPRGRSLSAVRITADGGKVVVRAGERSWNPETGQGVLDFDVATLAQAAAPLAPRLVRDARARDDGGELGGDDWFQLGCELETTSPDEAMRCYRRALELE